MRKTTNPTPTRRARPLWAALFAATLLALAPGCADDRSQPPPEPAEDTTTPDDADAGTTTADTGTTTADTGTTTTDTATPPPDTSPNDTADTACDDADGDRVCDDVDLCPSAPDPFQEDRDHDGLGDACDPCPLTAENDADGDGVCAPIDNCPGTPNPTQADADADGRGDACDPCPALFLGQDPDTDGFCGLADNCPSLSNPDQADADADGLGDACDPCPDDPRNDADGDRVCAPVDNCPDHFNQSQYDIDADGLGDACDTCPDAPGGDTDRDGACDVSDNCPLDHNPDQADTNANGLGDACDPCPLTGDLDGDSICDDADLCLGGDDRLDANADGTPDACEACQWTERQRWTVSYHHVMAYSGEGPFSFQVSLYDDGEVEFRYDHMHNLAGPTVGLEAPGRGLVMPYAFPTINLPDETVLTWTPSGGSGFTVASSAAPGGQPYAWVAHPDDAPHLMLGDDQSMAVTLPFAFPWLGVPMTQVNVASNGYLWFGDPATPQACCLWQPQPLPTGRGWQGLIAPAWFDLNPTRGGHIAVYADTVRCEIDCAGTAHGNARVDMCGECAGGTTGVTPGRKRDCAGVCFGEAELDRCGTCAGGTTGRDPDLDDLGCGCFEPAPRLWYLDSDGDGLGAGEGVMACRQEVPPNYVTNADDAEPTCASNDEAQCGACGALDCAGVCGGGAAIDPCGDCAGGTTGETPAPPGDLNGDGYPDACVGPDLIVDVPYMRQHLSIDYVFVAPNDCYIAEGCVGGSGNRKVLRFGTKIANVGNADLRIGPPGQDPNYWEYDACHSHYHYQDYAFYQLFNEGGHELASIGYKNGWCVMDLATYVNPNQQCNTFTCANQGISAGCSDIYAASLACQWIDVTAIPDGVYNLRVVTNPYNNVRELRYDNNAADVRVRIQGDTVTLAP